MELDPDGITDEPEEFPVTAQFPGRCPECDDPIDPGEDIAASSDGWVHWDCRW